MTTATKKPKKAIDLSRLANADYLLVSVTRGDFLKAGGQYQDGTKCALALAIGKRIKTRDFTVSSDCVFLGNWRWEFNEKTADVLWFYARLVSQGCDLKKNVSVQVKMKKVGPRRS